MICTQLSKTFSLLLMLSACSFAPIAINVNLLESDLPEAKGNFAITTPSSQIDLTKNLSASKSGNIGPFTSPFAPFTVDIAQAANVLNLNLTIPNEQGFNIDFSNQTLAADLNAASLSYTLELSKTGPITAAISMQAYLAPDNAESPLQTKYLLGDEVQFSLLTTRTEVQKTVLLNAEQLAGIKEKKLRLAIVITGGTLSFSEVGEANLNYDLTNLSLNVSSVTTELNQTVPSENGIVFDFSKQNIPTERLKNLGLDYSLQLTLAGNLNGLVKSQLYIAPNNGEAILQQRYVFGSAKTIDLSQNSVTLTDRANFNKDQLAMLDSKTAKVILLITGESSLSLGQTIEVQYEFTKLQLFGGYSLN